MSQEPIHGSKDGRQLGGANPRADIGESDIAGCTAEAVTYPSKRAASWRPDEAVVKGALRGRLATGSEISPVKAKSCCPLALIQTTSSARFHSHLGMKQGGRRSLAMRWQFASAANTIGLIPARAVPSPLPRVHSRGSARLSLGSTHMWALGVPSTFLGSTTVGRLTLSFPAGRTLQDHSEHGGML